MSEKPIIACSLTEEDQKRRRALVRKTVLSQIINEQDQSNGVLIQFGYSKTLRERVDEFVSLEKGCCGFLTFTVSHDPKKISLLIEGPPEASETLDIIRRMVKEYNHE